MGLNIKNERVHALVREVARRTGRSQTGAVEVALTRMLEALDAEAGDPDDALDALLTAMQDEIATGPLLDMDLYDESGLPR